MQHEEPVTAMSTGQRKKVKFAKNLTQSQSKQSFVLYWKDVEIFPTVILASPITLHMAFTHLYKNMRHIGQLPINDI
jgi:hypothetical protein